MSTGKVFLIALLKIISLCFQKLFENFGTIISDDKLVKKKLRHKI